MDTVAITINLPTAGASREDYLHCVSSALSAAIERNDPASAMPLAGLVTLINEALGRKPEPGYIGIDFGSKPGFSVWPPHPATAGQ